MITCYTSARFTNVAVIGSGQCADGRLKSNVGANVLIYAVVNRQVSAEKHCVCGGFFCSPVSLIRFGFIRSVGRSVENRCPLNRKSHIFVVKLFLRIYAIIVLTLVYYPYVFTVSRGHQFFIMFILSYLYRLRKYTSNGNDIHP